MDSKRSSQLPRIFRAAVLYTFFSVFFLNAQPFIADWNNPVSRFFGKVYSYFKSTEVISVTNLQKKAVTGRVSVAPDPPPPPPPPK